MNRIAGDHEKGARQIDFRTMCTLQIVQATEAAALAASRLTGRGDEMGGDVAAMQAMAEHLRALPIGGRIIIGDNGYWESEYLQVGGMVGTHEEHDADIALMPLEGASINANALSNALSVIAMADRDTLLRAPSIYMEKIAIGPGFEEGLVGLDRSPGENIEALARVRGVGPGEITACILDRSRHRKLVEEVRAAGAAIRLIGDGDIAGVIQTTDPHETGIDIYMGVGGADQGILAAAALRCVGGQMEARLVVSSKEDRRRMEKCGIDDPNRVYSITDMVAGDVTFAMTGVTDGYLLDGVRNDGDRQTTQSMVMRASSGCIRIIDTIHCQPALSS
jgi:fructose-1,6-bisphosphatase II / sedoheptulose-1,7-bisphosphatase